MHCGKPYLWKEVQHTNYLIDCSTGPRFKDFSILPLKEKRSCIARGVIDCKNPTWNWCRVSPRAPLDTNQIVVQSIINCIFQAIQSQGMIKLWISTISAIWDTSWSSIALPGGLYSPPSMGGWVAAAPPCTGRISPASLTTSAALYWWW